jgi:TM2 domain-containing membrane protein YozV
VVNNIVTVNHPGYGKLVAGVLSIVPGLGHLYTKRMVRAGIWFAVVVGLYFLFVPLALFTHLVCIVAAIAGA